MSNGGGVSLVHTKSCSLSEDALALLESLPGLFRRTDGKFLSDMKESREKEITIDGMSPDIMKQLVDFAYTADISITQENAQQLLSAANLVQIHTIIQACCNFLEGEMDPSNCLGIHCFAEAHVCDELSEKARQYVIQHFTQVAKQEEILLLPKEKLIEFISQNDLNVGSEEVVFDAILRWVKHDPKHRIPQLADVLQYVRLPLVSPYYLFDKVDSEQLLMTAPGCRPFLDEAMKYHILKDRRMEMLSPRMIPRQCMAVETVVYITGGEIYNKNYLNCVEGYNLEGGTWLKLKDLPFSRCHHGAVVSEDMHMYIAGGYNKENVVVNNVMRYERYLDKWIKVASMNTPRAKLGMATLDGYIYAIGGYDGTSKLCSVERYCPQTNRWTYMSPLSQSVAKIVTTSLNGYLYAAGGVADPSGHCVNNFQRYNPIDDLWEQLSPMPTPKALSGLVPVKGTLYAVGGILQNSYASRELMSYNIERDTWTMLPQMKDVRYDPGVTTIGNKIYVLSGHDGENSFFSSIEVYDTESSRWSELPILTLPYGRCRFTCVAMDTKQG